MRERTLSISISNSLESSMVLGGSARLQAAGLGELSKFVRKGKAYRKSLEKYRSLFDHEPNAISFKDTLQMLQPYL
jgi:hypothetical protein